MIENMAMKRKDDDTSSFTHKPSLAKSSEKFVDMAIKRPVIMEIWYNVKTVKRDEPVEKVGNNYVC